MNVSNFFDINYFSELSIELIITFLGAFLGYVSAMLVERKLAETRRKEFVENIVIELIDIRRSLEETSGNVCDKDSTDIPSPFSHSVFTPIWDTVLQTGDIISLKDDIYYDQLISLYGEIKHWIMCENWLSENEHVLSNEQIVVKIKELIYLRNDIWKILSGNDEDQHEVYDLISLSMIK